jgi:manganese transport protein
MRASRFASALYWAVIPAAFIGPGTVTSAAKAGATYGAALLWALVFATLACVVLQTAAARIAVATGRDLGGAIALRFPGTFGGVLRAGVAGAVVLGCAAYQAGNLIGASQGLLIATGAPKAALVGGCVVAAAALLWRGAPGPIAKLMGAVVAIMGFVFVAVAAAVAPPAADLLRGACVPTLPAGSAATALALIGTTVVPYNLFLGSALAKGRLLQDVKFGTAVSVAIGGLVSAAILVAGTTVVGGMSDYGPLLAALRVRLGDWAPTFFGVGLFAAGFSSAITAPLAAGLTVEGACGAARKDGAPGLRERTVRFAVLLVGAAFAWSDVKPVPAIVAAQTLNGFVLPLAAAFVLVVANDAALMGAGRNRRAQNVLGAGVVFVAAALGAGQLVDAAAQTFEIAKPAPETTAAVGCAAAALLVLLVFRAVRSRERAA